MKRTFGGDAGGSANREKFVFVKHTPKFLESLIAQKPKEPDIETKRQKEEEPEDEDDEDDDNGPVYVFAEDDKDAAEYLKAKKVVLFSKRSIISRRKRLITSQEEEAKRKQEEEEKKKEEVEEEQEEEAEEATDGTIKFRKPKKRKAAVPPVGVASTKKVQPAKTAKPAASHMAAVKNHKLLTFSEEDL